MDGKEVIEATRQAIRDAEAAGVKAIEPGSLHALLNILEQEAAPSSQPGEVASLERYKAELAHWLSQTEHINSWNLEGFRQVIALGQSALRSIILINGGAAIALLAFVGNLATSTTLRLPIAPFAGSLRAFVFGVFLAAIASATTYLSQLFYDGNATWHHRLGVAFHAATVIVGCGSFAAFFFGADLAYRAFSASPHS